MLLKFLLAIAGTQSLGLRPEAGIGLNQRSTAASVGSLGDLVASAAHASASESLESLIQASDILGSMMTAGNATEHMSDDDVELLNSVISMVQKTIYASMNSSHQQDQDAVQRALDAIAKCNSDKAVRRAGDLEVLYQKTLGFQSTLNDNQTDVDEKTAINNTKFAELEGYISTIRDAPECSSFPAQPTKGKADAFFDGSEYVNWYTAQKAAYAPIAEAFEASDADLENAFTAYEVAKASRDVSYCVWKLELTNACGAFDTCYTEKLEAYQMDVTPRVQQDMQARIDAFKAGELIISQIRFLLGESTSAPGKEEPPIDASHYEVTFPDPDAQEDCSLAPLDAQGWVPKPECQACSQQEWPKSRECAIKLGEGGQSNGKTFVDGTGTWCSSSNGAQKLSLEEAMNDCATVPNPCVGVVFNAGPGAEGTDSGKYTTCWRSQSVGTGWQVLLKPV